MSVVTPLMVIPVGVLVERSTSASQWSDYNWRPTSVLTGVPDTPPWTQLSAGEERATFYAGTVEIELHRTETANYRDNLASGAPLLWVVLRPSESELPRELAVVTADPAEGEAMAAIDNCIVESVPMPKSIQNTITSFVASHHVERPFVKRKRDRADPDALARRSPRRDKETR